MPKKSAARSPSPKARRSKSPRGRPPSKRSASPRRRAGKPDPEALRAARAEITWFKRPITVGKLFLLCVWDLVAEYGSWAVAHPYTRLLVLPSVACWYLASQVEGNHQAYMAELATTAEYVVWWVGLGILSSVGLGSGMHTGIIFLFPHVFKVTKALETICVEGNNTTIDPRENMWSQLPFKQDFKCIPGGTQTDLFVNIYWNSFPAVFLWGCGTAMGEIPPYWTAYAAKISGEVDAEDAEDIDEVEQLAQHDGAAVDPVTATKIWMIKFMKRWGFWGVFLMSAWPNALFDLCGICCGSCLMPFWHFFTACWLGKACVKAPIQLVILIRLFSETYRDEFVEGAKGIVALIPAVGDALANKLQMGMDKLRKAAEEGEVAEKAGGFGVSDLFALAVSLVIATFALSCIEQFAQAQQRSYDEKILAAAGVKSKSKIQKKE